MVRSSQRIKHAHIKIALLMVDSPKDMSSHIKVLHVTYFRHQLGSNIPDLIMAKGRVLPCVTWDTVAIVL